MEQTNAVEEQEINLQDIWNVLRRNLVWIAGSTALFAVIGFLVTALFITPIYEGSATMLVNSRTDQSAGNNITNDQITSAKNLVNVYSIIITSDTVLNRVIDALDLKETYTQLVSKISVTSVNNTQVMRIAVKDPDAEKATRIVAAIVEIAPTIIMDTVEAGSVKTVSSPTASAYPVSPSKKVNTLIAALIGFALAFGITLVRHMLDNTFKSEADIQAQLALPVLGVIPSIESCENVKKGRKAL